MTALNRGKAIGRAQAEQHAVRDIGMRGGQSGMRRSTAVQRRVLLVEDEDMVRKVVSRMLGNRGYEVHAAASAAEAMALLDSVGVEFDLLVTDLMMPDGGGMGIARSLTERMPKLRVLLVSGYEASVEGWDPTRFRFLHKPFGSSQLMGAIDQLFPDTPAS